MSDFAPVILDNIRFLDEGISVLQEMSDAVYVYREFPFAQGGIGRHIRHVLDHYALFSGHVEAGAINYDNRLRDPEIEQSRLKAIHLFEVQKEHVRTWASAQPNLEQKLRVCHNGHWGLSCVGRELQHLINHTVHHYAFVALILRLQGVRVPDRFGVAPSTFQAQMAK